MKSQIPYEVGNNILLLDKLFSSYSIVNRIERLYSYFNSDEILFTSSFGKDSVYLLHLISRIAPKQKVYFLNTGFNFIETEEYKNTLKELLNLDIIELLPLKKEHDFSIDNQLWQSNPNKCCFINKVKPLETIGKDFKVWLSGLKKNQTELRNSIRIFENRNNIIKFHPLFDQSEESISKYVSYFDLPKHPLKEQGYGSIGCTHCTIKGEGRNGRWSGTDKTECGLHFDVNL